VPPAVLIDIDGDLHSGALIAGILILLIPRLLNYILALH
jgi:hypothetical protein